MKNEKKKKKQKIDNIKITNRFIEIKETEKTQKCLALT